MRRIWILLILIAVTGQAFAQDRPNVVNIERDQREEVNIAADSGWVMGEYFKLIGAYQKSLEMYPNPKAVNMTQFGRALP